ncbi:MAG: 2-amino-4-hydroxy-6-hydroxymethyldihydropteridine diphosphokinase [Candidatus Azobacteroides pseudotrichonymphae]|jgi:2-amino-4-hydroxy-6-hydroxymethyldihydropteridine diphosphokinase|nr:2-amino-4-hydroxy-6-hydroxymethyldihydropteridine diphosphokinase [Bacteroidales bacterium OttesenSCG-928-I14]GMO31994.1 MAG: 2-amino-4-hydroxy-6-hydroxymethyldihydropteridine diphosphokinase [Candidatus Azobacteroides pseudotrichonymphae]
MTTYLSLGTNLGNKELNLLKVIALIAERIGNLSAISSVYETQACGFQSANLFLNMALRVETSLQPVELLKASQEIERQMGRVKQHQYQDRIIDIDIILYDNIVYKSEELTIPHPLYRKREFVMKPLQEIIRNAMKTS